MSDRWTHSVSLSTAGDVLFTPPAARVFCSGFGVQSTTAADLATVDPLGHTAERRTVHLSYRAGWSLPLAAPLDSLQWILHALCASCVAIPGGYRWTVGSKAPALLRAFCDAQEAFAVEGMALSQVQFQSERKSIVGISTLWEALGISTPEESETAAEAQDLTAAAASPQVTGTIGGVPVTMLSAVIAFQRSISPAGYNEARNATIHRGEWTPSIMGRLVIDSGAAAYFSGTVIRALTLSYVIGGATLVITLPTCRCGIAARDVVAAGSDEWSLEFLALSSAAPVTLALTE